MAKKNIDLAVVLHDDCDYKDWLVELKERFYSHRLKASCATNGYLLDFYWKLGRDIEAKQILILMALAFIRISVRI